MSNLLNPTTIQGVIIWGVVAGVLASWLLVLGGLIFARIIVPWYQALVFQGADLQGLWVYRQTLGGIDYEYQMILRQNAHALTGRKTLTKAGAPPGPRGDYVQQFDVSGSTWEGFVTLNMKSADRRSLSFATSLLQIRDRGQSLVGQLVYRSSDIDQVESEPVHWTRG